MRMLLKTKTNIITRDVIGREIKSVGSLHQSHELPLYSLNKLQDWNALFFKNYQGILNNVLLRG